MVRVLLIDNDSKAHRVLRMTLPRKYHVISSFHGTTGVETAMREVPDIILLDTDLPNTDGIKVLQRLMSLPIPPPVIILSKNLHINHVVEAISLGAVDYMVKPYILDDLTCSMQSHVAEKPTRIETFSEHPAFADLVGESPAMLDVKRQLWMYSASDLPVFITGESGTGKELAARIVHRLSKRCEGPFIAKNCAAIPSTLFETEVFGSERGAFTDAVSRPGSFELAEGGTLFLDEIGELAPQGQAKLLRALESSTITRVGASHPRNINTRLVSATNRKLLGALMDGSFREDLFYRINTLQVSLPPLRDRPEDIPLLAASLLNGSGARVSKPALEKLMKHSWPGNVRELRNVLDRGMLLAGRKEIQGSDIGFTIFS